MEDFELNFTEILSGLQTETVRGLRQLGQTEFGDNSKTKTDRTSLHRYRRTQNPQTTVCEQHHFVAHQVW